MKKKHFRLACLMMAFMMVFTATPVWAVTVDENVVDTAIIEADLVDYEEIDYEYYKEVYYEDYEDVHYEEADYEDYEEVYYEEAHYEGYEDVHYEEEVVDAPPVVTVLSGEEIPIPDGYTVIMVSAGDNHSLALTCCCNGSSVWAWGDNSAGQLGDGTTVSRRIPVRVDIPNIEGVRVSSIAAGGSHSLALMSDGTVWAWGNNSAGQLGDGTTTNRHTPVIVPDTVLDAGGWVHSIAAGGSHSIAVLFDGRIWAWGDNSAGQLGDGTTTNRHLPVLVQMPVPEGVESIWIHSIAAGGSHSLAAVSDGTVWAWGSNSAGQLGDGTTTNRHLPVLVDMSGIELWPWVQSIAAGGSHSLAIVGGVMLAWGDNSAGQLGDGTTVNHQTPVLADISGIGGWLWGGGSIAAGGSHSALVPVMSVPIRADTEDMGQFGDNYSMPAEWELQAEAASLAAEASHDFGSIWGNAFAWGNNSAGQLGDGTTTNRPTLVRVEMPDAGVWVQSVAGGGRHSLAIANGRVWAWGGNNAGQVGNGTNVDRDTPVHIPLPPLPGGGNGGGDDGNGITYYVAFPDNNFRDFILADIIGQGRTADDIITPGDKIVMAAVKELHIASMGIADLTGLREYFTGLEILDVSDNVLTGTLDVSGIGLITLGISNNTDLEELDASNNQLIMLDVSNNTSLEELDASNNRLAELILYNNPSLEVLDVSNNYLEYLDLSGLVSEIEEDDTNPADNEKAGSDALLRLYVNNNRLEELDVSNSFNLTFINVNDNELEDLDVSNNAALQRLYAINNLLESLDLSENAALTRVDVRHNFMGTDRYESIDMGERTPWPTTLFDPQNPDDEVYTPLPDAILPVPGELGSFDKPIPISSPDDFQQMVNDGRYRYHHYRLEGDIELTESISGGEVHGILDGNGHTITLVGAEDDQGGARMMRSSLNNIDYNEDFPLIEISGNLTVMNLTLAYRGITPSRYNRRNNPRIDRGALIGRVSARREVVIRNLTSTVPYVHGGSNVGGLIGRVSNRSTVQIDNVTIKPNSYGEIPVIDGERRGSMWGNNVGGLIGRVSSRSSVMIRDSEVNATVTGEWHRVGGLIGHAVGISNVYIYRSYFTGNVTGRHNVGGLIGASSPLSVVSIAYSGAHGNITGRHNVGGIVGRSRRTRIFRSEFAGSVTAVSPTSRRAMFAGGIAGHISGTTRFPSIIRESEMRGSVTGSMAVGGIAGRAFRTTIVDCRHSIYGGSGSIISTTHNAGGIAGHTSRSYILRTYSDAVLIQAGSANIGNSGRNVGGIVGNAWRTNIRGNMALSASVGSVTNHHTVGRIAGNSNLNTRRNSSNNFATHGTALVRLNDGLSAARQTARLDGNTTLAGFADAKYRLAPFNTLRIGITHTVAVNNSLLTGTTLGLPTALRTAFAPVTFQNTAWDIAFYCQSDQSVWIAFDACNDCSHADRRYHFPILRQAGTGSSDRFTIVPGNVTIRQGQTFTGFSHSGLAAGETIVSFVVAPNMQSGIVEPSATPSLRVTGLAVGGPITLTATTSTGRTTQVNVTVITPPPTATPLHAPTLTDDSDMDNRAVGQVINPIAGREYRLRLHKEGVVGYIYEATSLNNHSYSFFNIIQQRGPGVYWVTAIAREAGRGWSEESPRSEYYFNLAVPTGLRWGDGGPFNISWNPVTNATRYEVELFELVDLDDPDHLDHPSDIIDINDPNTTTVDLLPVIHQRRDYFFRVTAFRDEGGRHFISPKSDISDHVLAALTLIENLHFLPDGYNGVRLNANTPNAATNQITLQANMLYIVEFGLGGNGSITVQVGSLPPFPLSVDPGSPVRALRIIHPNGFTGSINFNRVTHTADLASVRVFRVELVPFT